MNPGIWGVLDYRAKLAAHKQSLRLSVQNNLTPCAKTNLICRAQSEVVEESSASMALSTTPTNILTEIVPRHLRDPICSSPPAPVIPKYQGDQTLIHNVSVEIESSQNVRFWVTGLPPSITITELLGAIRGVGSIFATHIVRPQLPDAIGDNRLSVRTSAASIAFFTVEAGNIFMKKYLEFGTYKAVIRRNRIVSPPILQNNRSRVLIIEGDRDWVNPRKLEWLANIWNIQYVTDSFVCTYYGGSRSRIFWAFGSFRAQAHAMFARLRKLRVTGKVNVWYGVDPCASFERRREPHERTSRDRQISPDVVTV